MKLLREKGFFLGKGFPFGLDLGDLSVKFVHILRKGNYHEVRSYGSSDIPVGSVVDGEIKKKDQVVSALERAIASSRPHALSSRFAYCSLPETKAFLRIIDVPVMSDDELKEAIKWEIEENIPLSIDQVYFDWQVLQKSLNKKQGRMDVLIVAVSRPVVEGFIEAVESAGVEIVGMEIESLAQARSLLCRECREEQEKTTMIIDIGDRRTSILIAVGGVIAFTAGMHTSSQMLTDAIAKGFGVSQEKAEKIKIEQGIGSPIKRDTLFQTVEPVLENLVLQVQDSIEFFLHGLRYAPAIQEVLLCGGGANTKGIDFYLARRLSLVVKRGDPWKNSAFREGDIPPIPQEKSLQYTTAIGLALRGFESIYEDLS